MPTSDSRAGGPPAKRPERSELITATGWRLVGPAADLVSDPQATAVAAALRYEDILHASRFQLRPRSARSDAVDVVLSVLNAVLAGPRGGAAEPLTREGHLTESSGRFHAVLWDTFAHGDRWAGELTWIHPHPVIGGVRCTTRVSVVQGKGPVELTVHVGAPGGLAAVRGFVGAGQARPSVLAELNRLAVLTFEGSPAEPRTLDEAGIDAFVRRVLLSERRAHPVAVLAPVEPTDRLEPAAYLVPLDQLTEEFLGLAHLYVIDRHQTTFRLTDALGDKRLSAYWGALRVYMPGFSDADSGMEHPLLVRDRVEDPVERAGLLGELGRAARVRVAVPAAVEELREAARPPSAPPPPRAVDAAEPAAQAPEPVEVPRSSVPAEAPPAADPAAAGENGTGRLVAAIEDLVDGVTQKLDEIARGLTAKMDALIDEVARLRTATVVRGANAAGVERRLGQFERFLHEHVRAISETEEGRAEEEEQEEEEEEVAEAAPDLSLVSVVQQAASEHSDALLILDSAVASSQESPYEDVHRVAMNLRAMAEIARRRQEGRLGMSLRDAFAEAGVDYRGGIARSTSKRQRQQYLATLPNGTAVECHEHIALGGGSYDPKHILRIYFTSRAPGEPRFVIAHVGRHFEVKTTT